MHPVFCKTTLCLILTISILAPSAGAVVCNGAPEAAWLGIDPPIAPQPYALPAGPNVITVSTTAELQAALAWNTHRNHIQLDIILNDGIYESTDLDNGRYLRLYGSHRLWAANLGGAVLKFGIDAGGNNADPSAGGPKYYDAGAEFHGLVFDIESGSYAPWYPDGDPESVDSYALINWGDSQAVRVEDCWFFGHGEIGRGVAIASPEAFVGRRLVIDGFRVFGIGVLELDASAPDLATPAQLSDLTVTDIDDPVNEPEWAEGGIWLAATGSLERAYVRDTHRYGVLTGGNLRGGIVRDVDVDQIGDAALDGVGIYLENTTVGTSVSEFCVGPATRWGVRSEWDHFDSTIPFDPVTMFPRGIDNTVHHGLIEASFIGVWFDQGTVNSAVHHCIFRNYNWAAVAFNHNVATLADWPDWMLAPGGWAAGNAYLEPAACGQVRDQHPNNTNNPVCE
ncbi:MAG: hypothetical protein AAF657_04695 [Acidobacteriota bacterium]